MSVILFAEPGDTRQPSPSIWTYFPTDFLKAKGLGYFEHEEFWGGVADTVASGEQRPSFGPFSLDCDDDTVTVFLSSLGGRLDIETDGDDNDAWALFTRPIGQTTLFSTKPWAFEVGIELGDVTMDGAMFVGLAENDGLSRDVVADAAGSLIGESLVGFQILTADPDAVAAVYKLDAGTAVEIGSDLSNSAAITRAGGTVASLTNDTTFKLGMRFDGKETLYTYFNGYKVAATTLSTSTFPDNVNMGLIIALKTGTGAAESAAVNFARFAFTELW